MGLNIVKIVVPDGPLQELEAFRIRLQRDHPSRWPHPLRGNRGIQTDVGADVDHHHAGLQLVGGGGAQSRTFVNVESDAMSEAVRKASEPRPID